MQSLYALTWALVLSAAPVFDPDATLRALGHDEGRQAALDQLSALSPPDRARAMAHGDGAFSKALATLAADAKARMGHRLRAVEAMAVLVGAPAVPALAERLRHTGTPEETAVARVAAVALRGLHAKAELAAASAADDPEIRATVAAAAAKPEDLCARLKDPWPIVRAAAARGLATQGEGAACIVGALQDRDVSVRAAALQTCGLAGVKAAVPALRALAGDAAAPVPMRADAVVALGRLNETEPARRILSTHLAKGGIVPLAEAAVSALAAVDTPESREALHKALASQNGSVVAGAALALAAFGDQTARPEIEQARKRVDARHRFPVDAALRRLGAATAPTAGEDPGAPSPDTGDTGPDPADSDPE
jgi:HEAT repeat protein